MGIRKEIREGKDMKESEQIYANLNMKKTGENIRSRRERLGMNRSVCTCRDLTYDGR